MKKEKRKKEPNVSSPQKGPFYMQDDYVRKVFSLHLNGSDLNVLRRALVILMKNEPEVTCYENLPVFARIQIAINNAEEVNSVEGGKENED